MQDYASPSLREMIVQMDNILRRQAELHREQQKLLDELSVLRAEKDDLLVALRRVWPAAAE